MPALNGFGTMLYGQAKQRPDGSYVTTKWFAMSYLPIVPLKSMRIDKFSSADGTPGLAGLALNLSLPSYRVLEIVPMRQNLVQIFLTWLWLLVPLGLVFGLAPLRRGLQAMGYFV
jgi:hypothetical protein